MVKILDAIKPRIKEAEKMEKALKKMGVMFDKIVVQLGKQRQILLGVGQISYSTLYQKRKLKNSSMHLDMSVKPSH